MTQPGNDTWSPASSEGAATPGAATESAPALAPPRKSTLRKNVGMLGALKRVWILLVIVLVVALGVFGVDRLRQVFGKTETTRPGAGLVNDPEPFNPKTVTYEIFGQPGAAATINYIDLDAQPQEVKNVALPWSITLTTTAPAASANVVAQGDGDMIGCRITVNGEVKDVKTSQGLNAQTFCLVKSA